MIEETGHVVGVEGQFAWVETARQTGCRSCSARAGCGTGLIGRLLGSRRTRVRAIHNGDLQVGDEVVLGISEQALVKGSLALYAAPLLTMIFGALLFEWFMPFSLTGDGAAIAGATVGFSAGLLWLRRFAKRVRRDDRYQPVVLRIVRRSVIGSNGVLLP